METTALAAARARAGEFADGLYDGDIIDEISGFTVDDLRELIAAAESDKAVQATLADRLEDKLGGSA